MARGLEIHRKREIRPVRWLIWLLITAAIAAGAWFGFRYFTEGELPPFVAVSALKADPRIDESPISQEQIDAHSAESDQPRYISIPSLGVDETRVLPEGLDENNLLTFPGNIHDTVWYEASATPGAGYGSVVISGHSDGVTTSGVFTKLGALKSGDEITLERGDGKQLVYRVAESKGLSLSEVSRTGLKLMVQSVEPDKEGLTLVTTSGTWVPRYQQFDGRLLVRAVAAD